MYDTFEGVDQFATFIPEDDNSYLDLVEYKIGNQTRLEPQSPRLRTLKHNEIETWLQQPPGSRCTNNDDGADGTNARSSSDDNSDDNIREVSWTFRLFIGSSKMRSVEGLRHFPFSRAVLESLTTAFQVPSAFLGHATAQAPLTMRFRTGPHTTGLLAILNRRVLIVTHDSEKHATSALVLGFCEHETSKLVKELTAPSSSLTTAASTGSEHTSPFCLHASVLRVAAAWTNVMLETRARRLVERKVAATELERAADMHWSPETHKPLDQIEFEAITRKLTTFQTQLAFDEVAIEQVSRLVDKLTALRPEYVGKGHCEADVGETLEAEYEMMFEQAKEVLYGLRNATQQVIRRMNVQLQTIYSLVAQRDNNINNDISKNTQKIAQASIAENQEMKRLAQQSRDLASDSRELARRTYRDSVGMRLMAIVNLCTLPGTFTATFFSTSFFDFSPSDGGRTTVSPSIWLYFIITIGLTALIAIPLWFTWRRSNQEIDRPDALRRTSTQMLDADDEAGDAQETCLWKDGTRSSSKPTPPAATQLEAKPKSVSTNGAGVFASSLPQSNDQQKQPPQATSATQSTIELQTLKASFQQQQGPPGLPSSPHVPASASVPAKKPTKTTTTVTASSSITTISVQESRSQPDPFAAVGSPILPTDRGASATDSSSAAASPAAPDSLAAANAPPQPELLPPGTEICRATSFGNLIPGALSMEEGALYHTPGLWFEKTCRVCAYPKLSTGD